ncbi:hypothetical protein EJ04DRAFT_574653 [Polyplosphaeria fusca]|uniref:Uncharacterized protein n=1 Tax=Polyplosphaeria fusca TaxID=682080 RepID=A0A9P4V5J1_9PLEO|nr:hypothetical protein EJ04DRAFT_574653 [Polyplosphaeria fusca]
MRTFIGHLLLAGTTVGATVTRIARQDVVVPSPTPTSTPYPSGDPPKIFPSRIRDLPEDDFDCWKSHVSYTSIYTAIDYAPESEKIIYTFPYSVSSGVDLRTYAPPAQTTLCDGIPRVTGKEYGTYPPGLYTTVTDYNVTSVSTWHPSEPTCTVQDFGKVCSKMWNSMSSISSRIESAGYTTDYPLDDPTVMEKVLKPPCTTLYSYAATPTPVTCSLDHQSLTYKVLYWPVHTAGNFCANGSHATITATPTIAGRPNTAHYRDMVLTSPTWYYILNNVQVKTFAGMYNGNHSSGYIPLGDPVTHPITMSQDPRADAIYSAVTTAKRHGGRHGGGWYQTNTSSLPFSAEDFFTVPKSHYRGPAVNYWDETIYQGAFTPIYTYPHGLKSMDEQWSVCDTMVLGDALPTYLALPTEKYRDLNSKWTYDWPEATPTDTVDGMRATPGSASGEELPAMTTAP